MAQQGDVILFQTADDGEIQVIDGLVTMDGGLQTAAYVSLFGGNEDGGDWWANIPEPDPVKRYASQTQLLLDTLPASSANLLRLQDAAAQDLAWMVSEGVAETVKVLVTIPALNALKLTIDIDGESFDFEANWRASV